MKTSCLEEKLFLRDAPPSMCRFSQVHEQQAAEQANFVFDFKWELLYC